MSEKSVHHAALGGTPSDGLLDAPTLLASCGADAVLLGKMLRSFSTHIHDYEADIRSAVDNNDAESLRKAAHKLHGLVSSFSCKAAAPIADLERMGAEGRLDGARECSDHVAQLLTSLSAALERVTIDNL